MRHGTAVIGLTLTGVTLSITSAERTTMNASGQEWAVEATGLVKTFGTNRAVDGVDLRVATGTVYGVLGPNGAGKTTTINMLATLLRPDAGTARIFGHDVVREPQIVRQLIGVTGQFASVDDTLSATENLVIFARLLGLSRAESKAKAVDLLERFGLTDAARKPLKKFSGGMRRRLDLAASLISQPPLIFLDEPTTGLDPRTRGQMWDTIRALVTSGSTVLLTTQYLDEADQLADRIAVIDSGRVVAEGTSDELKASVGTASLQLRVEDPADTDLAMRAIEQVLGVRATLSPEASRVTAPMADAERVADLLITLREAGVRLAEMSVQKPTLDEVFLTLTGHDAADQNTNAQEKEEVHA
jgi:ABC-2 type transport system ATP-binding protein